MAKKAKVKKTTTATGKKKAAEDIPKGQEELQPDQAVEIDVQHAEIAETVAPEVQQAAAPAETAESAASESQQADVPTVAPSVAVATRKTAAVPVAVPEAPAEPAAPVESPEPVAVEPPPTGILAILNVKTEAEAGVTPENLAAYRSHLEKDAERPIKVCGREPFGWERLYAWGLRDRAAYESRKALCPSYTDDLEIVAFEEEIDTVDGIAVRVKRLADGREFSLLLGSLKSADAGSKNAELLDGFASWLAECR